MESAKEKLEMKQTSNTVILSVWSTFSHAFDPPRTSSTAFRLKSCLRTTGCRMSCTYGHVWQKKMKSWLRDARSTSKTLPQVGQNCMLSTEGSSQEFAKWRHHCKSGISIGVLYSTVSHSLNRAFVRHRASKMAAGVRLALLFGLLLASLTSGLGMTRYGRSARKQLLTSVRLLQGINSKSNREYSLCRTQDLLMLCVCAFSEQGSITVRIKVLF